MMKYTITLLLTVFVFTIYAQTGEGNWWFFGENAGIHFDFGVTNSPSAVLVGQCNVQEACASFSDSIGNLILYTDGMTVWGSNHVVLFNGAGLMGSQTTTQTVIVPRPLYPDNYYVFTADQDNFPNGFRFSEVDMTMAGGFGGVIAATKNTLLFAPCLEKITVVTHANGIDYWVIGHQPNNSNFVAYKVTPNGVQTATPVISSIGHNYLGCSASDTRGYMKASPQNDRLALAIENQDKYELYDFDNSTGVLSNLITLTAPSSTISVYTYGVEFSPNGQLLYTSRRWDAPIYQWNLNAGSPTAIQGSCIQVGTLNFNEGSALQLGLDGKMYIARNGKMWLARIDNPNTLGIGCTFVMNAVSLGGKHCKEGLPMYIKRVLIEADYEYENTCLNEITEFSILNTMYLDSVIWNFNDTASGINNTSTIWNALHQFTQTGDFEVMLVTFRGAYSDTSIQTITIHPLPEVNVGNDTSVCTGTILTLDAGNPGAQFLWSDNSTNQTIDSISITDTTVFWVEVMENGCTSIDSIIITPFDLTSSFIADSIFCFGDEILISYSGVQVPNSYFYWDFGNANIISGTDSGPYVLNYSDTGFFQVSLYLENVNCVSDTSVFELYNPAGIELFVTTDSIKCYGESTGAIDLTISGGNIINSYVWNFGYTTEDLAGVPAGQYSVTVTYDSICTETISDIIYQPDFPLAADIFTQNILCYSDTNGFIDLTPTGGVSPYSFLWDNSETSEDLDSLEAGSYFVTITDSNDCLYSASFVIFEPDPFDIILNPNTTVCAGLETSLYCQTSGGTSPFSFFWNTGQTNDSIIVSVENDSIFSVFASDINGCVSSVQSVTLSTFPPLNIYQFSSTDTICLGDSSIVYIGVEGGNEPYSFYLENGLPIENPYIVTPEQTTTYTIYVEDDCATSPSISVIEVIVNQLPEVDFICDTFIGCPPLEVNFFNTYSKSGNDYLWYFGDNENYGFSIDENPDYIYLNSGIYNVSLRIIDANSCESSKTYSDLIEIYSKPEAYFSANPVITDVLNSNILFENISVDYEISFWDFDDGNFSYEDLVVHNYIDTGIYDVELIIENKNQCKDTVSMLVYVEDSPTFWAPNVVFPNSQNSENTIFRAVGRMIDPDNFHLFIYDRWGELIFSTNSYYEGWDGKNKNGELCKEDSYVWMVSYKEITGKFFQKTGTVTVIY